MSATLPTSVEIVVIGSGVAGAAVVTEILKANPRASIAMLEAGGRIKMRDFGQFQHFMVTGKLPQDSREIYDATYDLSYAERERRGENDAQGDTPVPLFGSRMFAYGGTTGHWGGWSFRMKPEDFRLRSSVGNATLGEYPHLIDWPLTYDELEPYYGEAEQHIGVSGDSAEQIPPRSTCFPYPPFPFTEEDGKVIEACKQLGITHSHLPIARYGFSETRDTSRVPCQTTGLCKYCPFGARFAAANHLDEIRTRHDHPRFEVFENAIVEKILLDSRSRASGVEVLDGPGGPKKTIGAGTIVLASGAIESPKLLLASTAQHFWKDGIGNDRGLVGRFLVTHPYFFFQADFPNPGRLQPQMGFPTLVSRHFDSEAEQDRGKFILVHPSSSPRIDLAREMRAGLTRQKIDEKIRGTVRMQLQGIIEVFSRYENTVTMDTAVRNRFGVRQTKIVHSRPPDFDRRMEYVGEKVAELFGRIGAEKSRPENPTSWRADHAACTTRMSLDEGDGVVDRDLKVHGMDNLYVCSNSVFSSLGAVNPTLTLTALALRLGQHLGDKLYATSHDQHGS